MDDVFIRGGITGEGEGVDLGGIGVSAVGAHLDIGNVLEIVPF